MDTSLIITTYNWPEALYLTLQSVTKQSLRPTEVIIADDGSEDSTAEPVLEVFQDSDIKWCHVRHNDEGVRQSRIRNLAVKFSRAPYLIFIDHDVVLHNDFILDHVSKAEDGCFLQGKRVILPEKYTHDVINRKSFSPPSLWSKSIGNRKNLIHSRWLSSLLSRPKSFDKGIRSCNLSMFKSDFIKVDGFDETYDKSWGREDSDLCYRLFHAGISIKILWFTAIQYHLKHGIDKWDKERLDLELQQTLDEKRLKAKIGLSRISSEGGIIASSKDRV